MGDRSNIIKELEKFNVLEFDDSKPHYKYMSIETALKVLKNQTLRFSSPKTFNDPFELHPELRIPISRAKKKFRSEFSKQFIKEYGSRDNFEEILSIAEKEFIRNLDHNTEELEFIKKNIRILCLSETYSSALMWSHYASNHRGICLGIIGAKINFEHPYNNFKINYVSELKPITEYGKEIDESVKIEYWVNTKSSIWNYEKECRIHTVNRLFNPELTEAKFMSMKNKLYDDLNFPIEAIEEIYFGVSTNPSEVKKVLKLLNKKNYQIKILKKAEIDSSNFNLKFNRL